MSMEREPLAWRALAFLVACLGFGLPAWAQDDPFEISYYPFVDYEASRIEFPGDSARFMGFYQLLDSLFLLGQGQAHIVHMGGSHVQADLLTGQLRERLQTLAPGLTGGRGFVFPFSVASTNNPVNFAARHTGTWTFAKNVQIHPATPLGLSGIALRTSSPLSTIGILLDRRNHLDYPITRVKVFHQMDSLGFQVVLRSGSQTHYPARVDSLMGYSLFEFDQPIDTLDMALAKQSPEACRFTLFGFSLENDEPGFYYHAIGVNGASTSSFLKCEHLGANLRGLGGDLVVIGLGTNDAYSNNFVPEVFRANYDSLLRDIRAALPQAAILLTVPNDSYLYRRHANPNTKEVATVIYDLAKEHGCGVWNFYRVMGGYNSISAWQRAELAQADKIHLTKPGYVLMANLLFNAFLRSYGDYLAKRPRAAGGH